MNILSVTRSTRAIAVAFLLTLFASAATFAATYVVPPDEVLARKAGSIVIGRALTSYPEATEKHGIETVTVFSIEDVLKGNLAAGSEVKIRTLGGVLGKMAKFVPGAPHFNDGERALLFLSKDDTGDYAVTDFALGAFGFAVDDTGRDVVIRTATEIHGWNSDGSVHHEERRDANRFVAFLRGSSMHVPMKDDYTVEVRPLIDPKAKTDTRKLIPTVQSVGVVTAYTLAVNEGDPGSRWKNFPTAVNWNKGTNETGSGVTNGGTDAINAAFASWNNDAGSVINYALTTSNSNTNGILNAADGVNNLVYEGSLAGIGAGPFSCASGGVLGLGGIQNGFTDATNVVGTEQFYATTEADVTMNVGVGACVGTLTLSVGNFNSAVTHEFGHTLGLRHSDKTRDNTAACAAPYDCASSAMMTAVLTSGLNAALLAWDQRAVAALYPPVTSTYNPPTSVEAHAISATQALVSWTAATGTTPGRYNIYRSADGTNYSIAGNTPNGATLTFTDTPPLANKAYLYRVRSADGTGANESTDSNKDLATLIAYTNPTLSAGISTIQAVDINQLRTAVDEVRSLYGIGAGSYTYLPATGGVTLVHATDILQLRTNLSTAINGLFGAPPTFTNAVTAGSSTVKAFDFTELRNVMR